MPEGHSQQRDAARASARSRATSKLIRLLAAAPPLTAEQRALVVAAAVNVRSLDASR